MRELRQGWGENIHSQRVARGWTQDELAERLDVTRAAVSYWESGERAPTDEHKLIIAALFNVAVRTLFPLVVVAPKSNDCAA